MITTGIFSVLLLFCAMITGGPFATIPTLTFYFPIGASVLAGPVFMLFVAKVPKKWALPVVGVLLCVLGTLTGMHWGMNFGFLLFSIIASLVAGMGNYKNKVLNVLAYILYSFGPMGTYLVFFFDRKSWISFMLKKGTEQGYIDKMSTVAGTDTILVMIFGTAIVAGISGLTAEELSELGLRTKISTDIEQIVRNIKNNKDDNFTDTEEDTNRCYLKKISVYRNKNLLHDKLNAEFMGGQIWGLTGRNGIGKTTKKTKKKFISCYAGCELSIIC